ncbi:MAG: cbb3-type cytochrome c oxidase subunit II [Opitutaceae bacterium]|nr:cbb3-type cytochrome c oxidase subunit II [Opitutaceae bacterium]
MTPPSADGRSFGSAITAVAATYVYFLIFAQFGFLEGVTAGGSAADMLKPVMTVMGLAGIGGSVLAGSRWTAGSPRGWLTAGFGMCAVAAGLTLAGPGKAGFFAAALLIGLGTGIATVVLAGLLLRAVGHARLGGVIGLGTGLAYGFCNVPAVFAAGPAVHAQVALAAAAMGALAGGMLVRGANAAAAPPAGLDYARLGRGGWVVIFLALVSLDSAAFYVIQHNAELKAATWDGAARLGWNAAVHLGVACLAGLALGRGWLGRTVAVGAVALLAACVFIDPERRMYVPGVLLYTAGVSVYSTALVYYPARSGRPGLAALVYAVAGWGGSAAGIGLAGGRTALPAAFVLAAGLVLALALLGRHLAVRSGGIGLVAAVGLLAAASAVPADAQDDLRIARGRAVYLSEGCITCHSQYTRPHTEDALRWGPQRPLAESLAEVPPLFGNRRQGPDLQNVGNRRTREWNRLHLMEPRMLTPGSRMPAYAHLFAPGDSRGDALLAYLESLGAGTLVERVEAVAKWQPEAELRMADAARQRRLFVQWCVPCHGPEGRGDGPAAGGLGMRPRDLTGPRLHISAGLAPAEEWLALARIIKFGIPGTAMAGREYLPDEAITALATYVQGLKEKK